MGYNGARSYIEPFARGVRFKVNIMEGTYMRKAITLSIGMFLLSGLLLGQFKVSGNVTDANSGDKLVGANVIVEGTESGTSTDVDG
mgnify:FL=1